MQKRRMHPHPPLAGCPKLPNLARPIPPVPPCQFMSTDTAEESLRRVEILAEILDVRHLGENDAEHIDVAKRGSTEALPSSMDLFTMRASAPTSSARATS